MTAFLRNSWAVQSSLEDLRHYPQLTDFTDEQLILMGLDCLAAQTANEERDTR